MAISSIGVLLFIARPRTVVLGNIQNSMIYRNVEPYPNANNVPGILMIEIDAPHLLCQFKLLKREVNY